MDVANGATSGLMKTGVSVGGPVLPVNPRPRAVIEFRKGEERETERK